VTPKPPAPGSKQKQALAYDLVCRWQDHGDVAARARLIAMHMPLVGKVIARYPGAKRSVEARDEATSEALLGLIHACDKFDRTKSNSFGAYATLWVRAHVLQSLRSNRMVRMTSRAGRKLWFGLGRAAREIEREGREATSAAIAEHLGLRAEDVANLIMSLQPTVPFELPVASQRPSDKDRSVAETTADTRPTAEEQLAEVQAERRLTTGLYRALTALDQRERFIIEHRHLCDESAALSLRECAAHLGLSGERVRQIEGRAFEKMRPLLAELYEENEVA
jgi:RNA polymerase sigma-32 factor